MSARLREDWPDPTTGPVWFVPIVLHGDVIGVLCTVDGSPPLLLMARRPSGPATGLALSGWGTVLRQGRERDPLEVLTSVIGHRDAFLGACVPEDSQVNRAESLEALDACLSPDIAPSHLALWDGTDNGLGDMDPGNTATEG